MPIKNMQIESTMLGIEDHGIMTCMLYLTSEAYSQGFGGYALDEAYKVKGEFIERRGTAYGMQWIIEIMRAVGVEKWEDLKGKYVRVQYDGDEFSSKIIAIGHITNEKWFIPKDLQNKYFPEKE